MGKTSDKAIDGPAGLSHDSTDQRSTTSSDNMESRTCTSSSLSRTISIPAASRNSPHTQTSHLVASVSSPSLLAGCADANTHAGANIERHVQAHNIQVIPPIPDSPLSPIPIGPNGFTQAAAFSLDSSSSDIPPDSVFLTPSPTRSQRNSSERPSSVPTHHLERISGTLLRLVGDHYMCSTCGRQLRTMGDQLTLETSINHIRRAISSGQLDMDQGQP